MASWLDETPRVQTNLVVVVDGLEKSGKTYFSLRWPPDPVLYLNLDRRNDYLIRLMREKYHRRILLPKCRHYLTSRSAEIRLRDPKAINEVKLANRAILQQLEADYSEGLSDPAIKTVVLDQGTTLWELIRLSLFGKLTEVPPILYSRANARFFRFTRLANASGRNVILIHRCKAEWLGGGAIGEKTGNLLTAGHKEVNFEVDATVRCAADDELQDDNTLRTVYSARIASSGLAGRGKVFKGKHANWTEVSDAILGRAPKPPKE